MIKLYQIAIDPNQSLEARYAAVKLMQEMRKANPINHLKQYKKSVRQRKYNINRIDWRVQA